MPRLSDSMEEGTIVKWLVAQGDAVELGQPLVEIETDKATVTYEADESGVILALYVREGALVPVGAPIAVLGEAGDELITERSAGALATGAGADAGASVSVAPPITGAETSVSPGPPTAGAGATIPSPPVSARAKASPLARRLACRARRRPGRAERVRARRACDQSRRRTGGGRTEWWGRAGAGHWQQGRGHEA